jgi:hypothetical protein
MLFIRRLHAENFAAQNLMHEMRRHSRDLDHRRHFAHADLNGNATRSVKADTSTAALHARSDTKAGIA